MTQLDACKGSGYDYVRRQLEAVRLLFVRERLACGCPTCLEEIGLSYTIAQDGLP